MCCQLPDHHYHDLRSDLNNLNYSICTLFCCILSSDLGHLKFLTLLTCGKISRNLIKVWFRSIPKKHYSSHAIWDKVMVLRTSTALSFCARNSNQFSGSTTCNVRQVTARVSVVHVFCDVSRTLNSLKNMNFYLFILSDLYQQNFFIWSSIFIIKLETFFELWPACSIKFFWF